ncbi:AAA family ATPase [Tsukamurella sp. 8F]|uniref:HelD family protein n=1 Tax=unclassified Tsukamurella TaxID=2633480 RepID=UPI0023BA33B2|nr:MULTISPECIES: ATP-binding domain-containing protein [unclassified Tsukamurella]MDF0528698.1 AAA family ATPase [Tsukamurella sp. 8J]MDF0585660.1 AAA family ATPase [Tsukamurella sp. 8F]
MHLDRVYTRIDAMRATATRRRTDNLAEVGENPQELSERDSFHQLYTDDLAKYDAAEHNLYFGRLDMDEQDDDQDAVRRIGRIGVLDGDDSLSTLLLDWRAPLARPFYLATPAQTEGVHVRRHIRTRGRRVTAVTDERLALTAGEDPGTGPGANVAGESALVEALDAARTGHMTDIVETIQLEQDAIIRSEHRGVMVVQGGPGTGKTAVALHRAAYLLYTYRQNLSRTGVLIVGPNETFLDYISRVLPSLGETGVLLSTVGDLYPGVVATLEDASRAAELKGSTDMIEVMKQAVRSWQTLPPAPVELRFDGYPLTIDKKVVTRARGRARSSRRAHNLARPLFMQSALDQLAEQHARTIGSSLVDGSLLLSRTDVADIRDELADDPEVTSVLAEFWPELSPQHVLADLWADTARLARAAPDLSDADRAALARATDGFSPGDAPLLDELAELLGIDDEADAERAEREWRKRLTDAQEALDILTGSAPADLDDELDSSEILMAYDLIDAEQLAERQNVSEFNTTADRARADRTWTFGHVIVDEAQELSAMAWRMIMRRIPNRWMTVVGDTAQTSEAAGTSSWASVLDPYTPGRWRLAELTVNYRTPEAIMDLAAAVLKEIDPASSVPTSVRQGETPGLVRVPDDGDLVATVADVLPEAEEQDGDGDAPRLTAVLAPPDLVGRLRTLAAPAVRVMPVRHAKGLEFDHVIVVEPGRIADESDRGLQDLYVALTRATQTLTLVASGSLPPALRRLDN